MTDLVTQPSLAPTRKVAWATMAAAGSSVLADILIASIPTLGTVDPAELELFLETTIVTLATLAAGWLVRDRA